MADLSNRVAVITGGRRGIGRAIAELLARRGADVMIGDCTDDPGLSTAAEIAAATGRRVLASCVDVSKSQSAKDFIDHAVAEFGHVDILVNNAGVTRDNLIMRISDDDWDMVLNVNLKGAFNCSRAVARQMMRQRYGRIVNISSVAGLAGNAGRAQHYAGGHGSKRQHLCS